MPTLRFAKALLDSKPGVRVELIADDPMARIDAPHYLADSGHELILAEIAEGLVRVVARRRRTDNEQT